ncbi:hypothetical protein NSTCB13_01909 [Nostoc sp. DSM 114160]|jgi:hypothetical protein
MQKWELGLGKRGKAAHKNPFPNKDESLSPKSAKVTFARGVYWIRPIICYQKQKSQLETDFTVFIQLTMGCELLNISVGTLLKILEVLRPCVTRNFR